MTYTDVKMYAAAKGESNRRTRMAYDPLRRKPKRGVLQLGPERSKAWTATRDESSSEDNTEDTTARTNELGQGEVLNLGSDPE